MTIDVALMSVLISAVVYAVIFSIALILCLTKSIGLWGIFSKAGIPEWKSIVPFYNQIVILKELKMSPWLIILYLDFVFPIFGSILGRNASWAFIIASIGFLIYRFILAVRLGESFKKKSVFCFFLAFFPSILYPVLGCSKGENYERIPTKSEIKSSKNS